MSHAVFLKRHRRGVWPLFHPLSNGDFQMTQDQFNTLCQQHLLSPEIALENDDLVQALRDRDDERVVEIITNEF
jgi:hypothetical protein